MNQERFHLYMSSVDDSLLEEALQPNHQKRRLLRLAIQTAACIVLITGSVLFYRQLNPPVNRHAQAEDLQSLDYNLPLLEAHVNSVTYTLYDSKVAEHPMAEAIITLTDNSEYVVRSLKTEHHTDISGLTTQEEPLIWSYGPLEFQLCSNATSSWLSWYSEELQLQYCISTDDSASVLLQTATDIVSILGYDMAVSPEGATDISYEAFLHQGLTVAETSFLYKGHRYCFRMAATTKVSVPFADISGLEADYATHMSSEVLWCPAELYYNEGLDGKIIWFDLVPGLLYSLSTDSGASNETLLEIATLLFNPAQGND